MHSYCFKSFMGDRHRVGNDFWTPCAQTLLHWGSFCLRDLPRNGRSGPCPKPLLCNMALVGTKLPAPWTPFGSILPSYWCPEDPFSPTCFREIFPPTENTVYPEIWTLSFPHCSKFLLVQSLEAFWPLSLTSLPHPSTCQPLI